MLISRKLSIRGANRKFSYRWNSYGDRGVIKQIFRKRDYDLSPFALSRKLSHYQEAYRAAGRTGLIIDAGANIGASAIYFYSQYSDAIITAIEPERKNCTLLRKNCAGIETIHIMEAALGSTPCRMHLNDPDESDWGFRVSEKEGLYEVDMVSVAQILKDFPPPTYAPFICKIDIEGGEKNLFEKNTEWVQQFPLVIIELHDWMLPGEANSRNFLQTIASLNFDFIYRGENVFCFNNDLLK